MLLIAIRKGGVKCSSACPFYTETGQVTGVRGIPLKTHCRMTMNPWMVDCDIYNPNNIHKVDVTEEEFQTMLKAVHKRAIKQRKLYPEDHENANQVGCEWTRSKGKFNAEKSKIENQKSKNE